MTIIHVESGAHGAGAGRTLSALWAGLRAGLMTYHEGNRRIAEVRRLQALSDAALAERGLARDRIVHFVFRDLFGT